MQSVLITGGAGFIGSALGRALLDRRIAVTAVDDLSTGFRDNLPEEIELVVADVADRESMRRVFEGRHYDAVLHLAAQVSNIISHRDPWADFRTNVGGTINVIEQVAAHRIPRVLYASSMAIYGRPDSQPVRETARPQPLSPYAVSKLAAEQLLHNAAKRIDLDFHFALTSMRMFNVYGPGQSLTNMYQGVISVFIADVLTGQPITLFGDGSQTRDFVYIDDVVSAWLAALDTPTSDGERINVGSGQERSIAQLIDDVLRAFGHDRTTYTVDQQPELPGDQRAIQADIALAGELLGWSPRVSFEEGLKATVKWARAQSRD